MIGQFIASDL